MPYYGYRCMAAHLDLQGDTVNDKRVCCLMHLMGLEAIYQKPRTNIPSVQEVLCKR
jgi:putative transposase